MDSDVAAWRLAWKLEQAQKSGNSTVGEEELFNIFVVDDENNPIHYYGTGRPLVFNPIAAKVEDAVDPRRRG